MKLVKALGITAIIVALIGGAFWQFWLKDQVALAKIGTNFASKHVCSCLHVAERTMESCLDDFVLDVGQLTITDDGNITTAKAPMGLASSQAKFEPGLGCAFVKP